MKNLYLTLMGLFLFASVKGQQTVAVCKQKHGCEIAKLNLSRLEIDKILDKNNFLVAAGKNAILVLENCNSLIEEKRSTTELHKAFGGKAMPAVLKTFDLRKYLVENRCFGICPNPTKKISFKITAPEHSGSGYFFANLKGDEAFMPNAAFQQFYAGQEGFSGMTIDAFFRNYKYVSYIIDPEGKKFRTDMAIGTNIANIGNQAGNIERFKRDFKATGKKRKHLNTADYQYEYLGKGEEGPITFWLGPAYDVCLAPGQFAALGFWNLGYIAVDGKTYLLAEISGSGFKITVTDVSNGTYTFNPAGYQTVSMPVIK